MTHTNYRPNVSVWTGRYYITAEWMVDTTAKGGFSWFAFVQTAGMIPTGITGKGATADEAIAAVKPRIGLVA